MADTPYLPSDLQTGFSDNDILALRLETQNTFNEVFNHKPFLRSAPEIQQYSQQMSRNAQAIQDIDNGSSFIDQLTSDDPKIRETANSIFQGQLQKDPRFQGVGGIDSVPTTPDREKFIDKQFGWNPYIDNEDYYYNEDYLQQGTLGRLGSNVVRFTGRVVVPAFTKLLSQLGNVGAMITTGWASDGNYWENVADNAFSKYFDGLEEDFKNHVAPIYKKAGLDEEGLFSKLGNYSFWNESVADGFAFALSTVAPTMGLGQLGKVGALGKAFSETSRLGKIATKFGVGSPVQVGALALNTAMESSVEAAEKFRETKEQLELDRAQGLNILTDEEITERAGKHAAGVFKGNMLALVASNAFENTIIFKPFKSIEGTADVKVKSDLHVSSKALDDIKNPFKSGLNRTTFYGKKAFATIASEGLWEENAQLAISRINKTTYDEDGAESSFYGGFPEFIKQLASQSVDAFSGRDDEALESMVVGGIIGTVMGPGFSLASRERRKIITNTKTMIKEAENARNNLFSVNDILQRDSDGKIVFDEKTNLPKANTTKLEAKKVELSKLFEKINFSNLAEYQTDEFVKFETQRALSDYVASMVNAGFSNIGERLQSLDAEGAALFNLNPNQPKASALELSQLAKQFEGTVNHARNFSPARYPSTVSPAERELNENNRKYTYVKVVNENIILNNFINSTQESYLKHLNKNRGFSNTSISQYATDELNSLLMLKKLAEQSFQEESGSDSIKEFFKQRVSDLEQQIKDFKTNNSDVFDESLKTPKGFYIPIVKDSEGNVKKYLFDATSSELQARIANYQNLVAYNDFIASQMENPNEVNAELDKIHSTPETKKAGTAASRINKTVSKFELKDPEHFHIITKHIQRSLYKEGYTPSQEVTDIINEYPELVQKLFEVYQSTIDNHKSILQENRLSHLKREQETLAQVLISQGQEIADKKTEIDNLQEELLLVENNKPVNQKKIQKAIKALSKVVKELEDINFQSTLQSKELEQQIIALEQETKDQSFSQMSELLESLREEKLKVEEDIQQNQTIINEIKDIINIVRRAVYKRFGKKAAYLTALDENNPEALFAKNGIEGNQTFLEETQQALKELEPLRESLNNRFQKIKADVELIIENTNRQLFDDLVQLTQQDVSKLNQEENLITEGLTFGAPETIDSESGDFTETQDAKIFDGATYQRPLTTKFQTTTFTSYENGQTIPLNVEKNFKLLEKLTNPIHEEEVKSKLGDGSLQALVVTSNNIKALNLEASFKDRLKFFDDTNPASTNVEVIPVLKDPSGDLYYIDENLNKIGKVGEAISVTLPSTPLRSVEFTEAEENQYFGPDGKYNKEQRTQAVDAAIEWRTSLLELTKNQSNYTTAFTITKGIPNKEFFEGMQAENPVVGTLILPEQLQPDTITVFSQPNQTLNGENIELPVGRPFIKTVSRGYTQLHPANNRILNQDTAQSVLLAFKQLLTEHKAAVLERVNVNKNISQETKDRIQKVGLENLTSQEKRKIFLEVTKDKETGISLFNNNLQRFLGSVVFYKPVTKGKTASKNQIYIKGYSLVFGENGPTIDITNPALLDNPDVSNYISTQFHNISYYPTPELQAKDFIEFYESKGELKTRIWPNYSTYLVSEKFPNGEARDFIPVTTAVKTQSQLDKTTSTRITEKIPYKSRAITLIVPENKHYTKKTTGSTTVKPVVNQGSTVSPSGSLSGMIMSGLGNALGTPIVSSETSPVIEESNSVEIIKETTPPAQSSLSGMIMGGLESALGKKDTNITGDVINTSTEENTEPPSFDIDDNLGANWRVALPGSYVTENEIDWVVSEIQRMLPQFPVNRLKTVLKTSNNQQAWGQFKDNIIHLYELAEKGTGFHEAFEAVVNRLLSDSEWNSIYKEFKSRKGFFQDRESGQTIAYSKATAYQAKEALADEFMEYKLSGKLPEHKQAKSFIKIIWDFIKSFFSAQNTINDLFKEIDAGKLANKPFQATDRFIGNYKLTNLSVLPAEVLNDLHDSATVFLFTQLYNTPTSISDLQNLEVSGSVLYNSIKENFILTQQALTKAITTITSPSEQAKFTNAVKAIQLTLDNWEEFSISHKQNIKKLSLNIQDDFINQTEEEFNNINQRDYVPDPLKIDNAKSASTSVKLLLRTLGTFTFDPTSNATINNLNGANLKPIRNMAMMMSLAKKDVMLKVLDEFTELSDFQRFEDKLAELSGLKKMNIITNPQEREAYINSLPSDTAMWYALYRRIFGENPTITEDAKWKLKVRLNSYIGKFIPDSYTVYDFGNEQVISKTSGKEVFQSYIKTINSGITNNYKKLFNVQTFFGKLTFVPLPKYGVPKSNKADKTVTFTPKEQSITNFKGSEIIDVVEFLGLRDVISNPFLKALSPTELSDLINILFNIRKEAIKNVRPGLDIKSLDIAGYTDKLVKFLDKKLGLSQTGTQIFNINNQPQSRHILPSFTSRIISEINQVKTKDELTEKFPHIAQIYSANSVLLSKLFDSKGNRTNYQIKLGYIDGITNREDNTGTKTSNLEYHDRLLTQFNASLQGLYYTLPADGSTEFVFEFGEFESYTEDMLNIKGEDIVNRVFLPYLIDEINTASTSSDKIEIFRTPLESTGTTIGKSLRMFKDILSKESVTQIQKGIAEGLTSAQILEGKDFKAKINKEILDYIRSEAILTKELLETERLLSNPQPGVYQLAALSSDFTNKHQGFFNKSGNLNEKQLYSLLEYQKVNSLIGHMEIFKLILGDPAQFKAPEKRIKSFLGPFEETFYDKDGKLNNYLNQEYNLAKLEGQESVSLLGGEFNNGATFATNFSNDFNFRTVADLVVVDVNLMNTLNTLQSEFANRYKDEYEDITETDGQSIGTLAFTRQLFIKSGWRWTPQMEEFYQYDTALMRQDLSKLPTTDKHHFRYTSPELEAFDKNIVKNYDGVIPEALITPYKTIMPAVNSKGKHILLKHSIYNTSYTLAKQYQLVDVYIDMLKDGVSILNFKSAQKDGNEVDNNNEITNIYSDPYTLNDLNAAGNPIHTISFRHVGIQVETQGDKVGGVGSQLTKLSNLNTHQGGIPVDFMLKSTEKVRIQEWRKLSEQEKLDISEMYRLVSGENGTTRTLEDLKFKNTVDKLEDIGIPFTFDGNNIVTTPDDLRKIREYIINEALRLEVDQNTIDSIRLSEDYKSFVNAAEGLPSYTQISNILWSIADKSISSFKINGKPLVQVSSAFFNKETRKAAYKDGDKWITVNTKEEYDELVKKGKKLVLTSSELAFYGKDPVTGKTTPMEVLLPNSIISKVNAYRVRHKMNPLSEEELMEYLNENPSLLEGIGFRIPTQATSSIDFFKVKGFLPKIMGNAVVVPSALTKKSGSDFDVDKLNTYLNNWVINRQGYPELEVFNTTSPEQRYINHIKSKLKSYGQIRRRLKDSSEYLEIKSEIDERREEISEVASDIDYANQDLAEAKEDASQTFNQLPIPIQDSFYNAEILLKEEGVKGVQEYMEYIDFIDNWIKTLEGKSTLNVALYDKNYQPTSEKVSLDVTNTLPLLKTLKLKYEDILSIIGIKADLITEFKQLKAKNFNVTQEQLQNWEFQVALIQSEFEGLISFQDFQNYPIELQNSKGALENRYFKSIRNILEHPAFFENLLSPNSLQHLKNNRTILNKALEKSSEEKKEVNFTRLLSDAYISRERHLFVENKNTLGIFAQGMTNLANSQLVGIGFSIEGGYKTDFETYIMETLNERSINLPFKDTETTIIDGIAYLSISKTIDSNGDLLMDKQSSYINGTVDVVSDKVITELGVTAYTAGTVAVGERVTTGGNISLFINLPIVKEFTNELRFLDKNSYYGAAIETSEKKIIEDIRARYYHKGYKFNPDFKITTERLSYLVNKGTKPSPSWTNEEKDELLILFANFLKMRVMTNHLLESTQTANHDTSRIRSHWGITLKDIKLNHVKKGNLLVSPVGEKLISGAEALREKTFIKTEVKLYHLFNKTFSQIKLFALQGGNPSNVLNRIANNVFEKNPYISLDDFIDTMREFETTLLDYAITEQIVKVQGVDTGNTLRSYYETFFKVSSPNSIKKQVDRVKAKYPQLFKTNLFLSNLEILTDQSKGIHTLQLKNVPSSNQALMRDMLTQSIRNLSDVDPVKHPDLVQFYKSIVYATFLQFGVSFSRNTYLQLIPYEVSYPEVITLGELMQTPLNNLETLDLSNIEENIYRSRSHKRKIISPTYLKTATFLYPDDKGQISLAPNPTLWIPNGQTPRLMNQTFFGKSTPDGQIIPNIHPMFIYSPNDNWNEAQDYVLLRGIRPEYLVEEVDGRGNSYLTISDEVKALKKKGLWNTFTFDILYKKVGLEDPSLARIRQTKNKAGDVSTTILYKPIYKKGDSTLNEIAKVTQTFEGTTIGSPSIIQSVPFTELEDNDLIRRMLPNNSIKTVDTANLPLFTNRIQVLPEYSEEADKTSDKILDMKPENIIKVAKGQKTSFVGNMTQAKKLGIPANKSEERLIGGDSYLIKNNGFMTIQQAGGLQKILATEGVSTPEEFDYPHIKEWISGKTKLVYYTIQPVPQLTVESIVPGTSIYNEILSSLTSDINKGMFQADPAGFLEYISAQVQSVGTSQTFTPGTGLDAYPQRIKDIALKLFPPTSFLHSGDKPPIIPEC